MKNLLLALEIIMGESYSTKQDVVKKTIILTNKDHKGIEISFNAYNKLAQAVVQERINREDNSSTARDYSLLGL
jgi:hypothetical protein